MNHSRVRFVVPENKPQTWGIDMGGAAFNSAWNRTHFRGSPPLLTAKLKKWHFPSFQSVGFFFFLVPQNFVLVKWQADGVTTKWVQQNIVIHDEKKTVVDNDGKMVGWWASLHLLHPSQREYQHKFSKTILMDHGCACQKLEYHCSATLLPKKAVGSNYIWSQLPIEDYGVFFGFSSSWQSSGQLDKSQARPRDA